MANLAAVIDRRANEREEAPYKDAFGNEHDPTDIERLWTYDG